MDGGLNQDSGSGWVVRQCTSDLDCSDAVFCNGTEVCAPNDAVANTSGCVPGVAACAGACDEIHDVCVSSPACVAPVNSCRTDADCGEYRDVCTASATCDPASGGADARGCVTTPAPTCAHGCDPAIGCLPASPQVTVCVHDLECGGYCNGGVCDPTHANAAANGCRQLGILPSGFCAALSTTTACCEAAAGQPRGCYNPSMTSCVASGIDIDGDGRDSIGSGGDDCDDYDANSFPGNVESCDALGHDEDCDPSTVATMSVNGDADRDGIPSSRCRNLASAGSDVPTYTVYSNGVVRGADCDDADRAVNPFGAELCNGRDDDCDGTIDEFVTIPMYFDRDGDGFGDPMCTFAGCGTETGFVRNAFDCADYNAAFVPGTGPCIGDATLGICARGVVVPAVCGSGQRCVTRVDGTGSCERR